MVAYVEEKCLASRDVDLMAPSREHEQLRRPGSFSLWVTHQMLRVKQIHLGFKPEMVVPVITRHFA